MENSIRYLCLFTKELRVLCQYSVPFTFFTLSARMGDMKEILQEALKDAFRKLSSEGETSLPHGVDPSFDVTFPKDDSHGDYTSNIALSLAGYLKQSPLDIAHHLERQLTEDNRLKQFTIEIVAPGYINFSATPEMLAGIVAEICTKKGEYGSQERNNKGKVLLEFISANPTGPLHMGNARGGFFGDTFSRILKKCGYDVSTEYYVNDAGEQVAKLGHSVLKDTEAVYGGEYIDDLGKRWAQQSETSSATNPRVVGEWAGQIVLKEYIQKTVSERMGISFDAFISEKNDIVEAGYVDRAISFLKENGLTYEEQSALWFRTTQYGDDKDRVLIKANGEKTYFASDCGYLLHKKERSFDRISEVWGADHHGYVARFHAAAEALGFARDRVTFTLVQLVRLVKDGQEVRMSKRAGNIVTVDELLDRIDVDVVRFFFLMYSPDTHMNFDMGLAEERSQKNPVFYVQYAHARMASIFRKAEEELGINMQEFSVNQEEIHLQNSKEILLVRHLAKFSEVLCSAVEMSTVHQLPQYAIRLADLFHSFYNECTVLDAGNMPVTQSRLALVGATKNVLSETLRLIGVSAPEKM